MFSKRQEASSHLLKHPLSFEAFLYVYLVAALCIQNVNIYKKVSLCWLLLPLTLVIELTFDRLQLVVVCDTVAVKKAGVVSVS